LCGGRSIDGSSANRMRWDTRGIMEQGRAMILCRDLFHLPNASSALLSSSAGQIRRRPQPSIWFICIPINLNEKEGLRSIRRCSRLVRQIKLSVVCEIIAISLKDLLKGRSHSHVTLCVCVFELRSAINAKRLRCEMASA
jgi:hypothetical protein